ncbi:unnamed protein product [Strongylus vulgaris]|uniref:Uncharacterized protein n=1 Tax=Strongylus vulgaris TaxID=40348 RepID=A0A3P7JXX7_STRVU|nr:unnamed protein product [Strongylus vulgaris]
MVEQVKMQHDEMKSMFVTFCYSQGDAVQDASKDHYDQLSSDVQRFASDEEKGNTFTFWFTRYGGHTELLLDNKKRHLVLMKLNEE